MFRRFAILVSVASLLVSAVALVLWARSYKQIDDFRMCWGGGGLDLLRSWRGMLLIRHTDADAPRPFPELPGGLSHLSRDPPPPPPHGTPDDSLTGEFRATSNSDWGPVQVGAVSDTELARRYTLARRIRDEQLAEDLLGDLRFYLQNQRENAAHAISLEQRHAARNDADELQAEIDWRVAMMPDRIAADRARWQMVAPLWFAAVFFATGPIVGWTTVIVRRKAMHRRRRRKGQCAECGYDMRGTPERCPECGAVSATRSRKPGCIFL